MRVVVFFLVAFGGLLLPVGSAALALLLAPFPYERTGPRPETPPPSHEILASRFAPGGPDSPLSAVGSLPCISGMRAGWNDDSALGIAAFGSAEEAAGAVDALFRLDSWSFTSRTNAFRYTAGAGSRSDGKPVELFAWTEDSWLFWIEAPSSETMEQRIRALPFIEPRLEKPLIDRLFGEQVGLLLGIFAGYLILLVPVWTRTASWAAVAPARSGVTPVPCDELRRRLLALNRPDHPFRVTVDGPWITAEWNVVDRHWVEILSASGIRLVHRVRMRLDPDDTTVRAQDHQGSLTWSTGTLGLAPQIAWSVERGIVFADYRFGVHPALRVENGRLVFGAAAAYRFNLAEMKGPIVEVVTQSGWTWRPVLSFLSRALFG